MSIFHILNEDALAMKFPDSIKGNKIIFRECLIEGPVSTGDFQELIKLRQEYMHRVYDVSPREYNSKSTDELSGLFLIPEKSNIYLWFEHDLFCQVNMLFTLYTLINMNKGFQYHVVYPLPLSEEKFWHGHGMMTGEDLEKCLEKAIDLTTGDSDYVVKVWDAYSNNRLSELDSHTEYQSSAFPFTGNALQAHLDSINTQDKTDRPQLRIKELVDKYGKENFNSIFSDFQSTEGVYGFGDLQIQRMIKELE